MADFRLTQSGEEVQEILNNSTPQTSLEAETARAEQAEGALQQGINTEAEARQQADTTLQQHIDAEAQTRQQQDAALQQLIQQVQASLINYYLKSETYSASQIDLMLAAIKQFRYQVVDVLPTPSADTMGIIYLVPSAHAVSGNIKDEYITLTRNEGSGTIYYFEQIGETAIDLSNYYTKGQTNAEISAAINTALAAYSTTTEMNAAISQAIATAVANYYTKAQTDALIANFITASVNNLVNYYLKSETFTKAEVNQLIAAVKQFTYVSVAELPTASAETMNKIYLVPSTNPQTRNVKDEFITISVTDQGTTTYSWEQIGSTEIDLSGYSTTEQMNAAIATAISTALASYYTKSETMSAVQINAAIEQAISTALASYYTKTQADDAITAALNAALASYSTTQQMNAAIATAIANYYTKAEVDALIANFITASVNNLVNYYLKSETFTKAEVQQLIDAVKQFTYVSVAELPTASADTMNKIYLVPSASPQTRNVKDEFITISVTDQGTTTYSWERIGSTEISLDNYYTKSQTDAAITAALNTALAAYSTTTQVGTMILTAINTALAQYYNKTQVDNIANTKTDKLTMTGEGAAVENHIMTISQDGNIKDGGKSISDLITMMNAITRHTRLTDFDINVLKQAVADQNLEKYGLKVGDQKTINGHTYVIAGLNCMKGSTGYTCTANHVGLIVIPHTTQAWNVSGNTSEGADGRGAGYKNSDLHYYLKNTLLPLVNTDLGAANLLAHSKLLSSAVNTTGYNRFGSASGCSSSWEWESDCKICALSEMQVYGGTVWSSSGYDTGEADQQLEVFSKFKHTDIFGGEYPWLRDVVSASYAAYAYNSGNATHGTASSAHSVAALILFH